MAIQTGDIRFARSAIMADVDSGGGPPTAQLIPDGASNAIFPDISEDARTGGLVEVRHIHAVLRNTDTDSLLGANVIVAEPPDDENVSITLIKSPSTFARRPDLVKLIEATSTPGSEFNGYLLENHVAGQRSLQLAQRPGTAPPSVNTSLVLVQDEGLGTEYLQFVRVRRVVVTVETRTVADSSGNPTDFDVQIASCELFSPLSFDFPGSPPTKYFTRASGKTKTRTVTVSDAGTFFSAARLTAPCLATDRTLKLSTIFTQLVPNTKTETPLLDQRPAGTRSITLTDSQGTLTVTDAVHSDRVFVTEANQGNSYVFRLSPPPAPGSVTLSYLSQGTWSTVVDDGTGTIGGGPGAGTVLYATGDVALTTEALPDYNSFVIATWASTGAFTNVCASGPYVVGQTPSFDLPMQAGANVSGATVTWTSGGATRTATASAVGVLSGDATGQMISSLGKVLLSTMFMPDAGANFSITYQQLPQTTVTSPPLSAGAASVSLALPTEPVPGTVSVQWTSITRLSRSNGANLTGTSPADPVSTTLRQTVLETSPYQQVVLNQLSDDGLGNLGAAGAGYGIVNYGGLSLTLNLTGTRHVLGYYADLEPAKPFMEAVSAISGV